MKKTSFLVGITLLTIGMAHAQSLGKVVIASTGTTLSGEAITLSFTLGETVIGTLSNTNGETLGQGFWFCTGESMVESAEDFLYEVQTMVYPNPVTDHLNISFKNRNGEVFNISVYDATGNQVYKKELSENTSNETINFNGFKNGLYILNIVHHTTKKSKSIKIIKQ